MLCIKKVISKKARGVSRSLAFDEFTERTSKPTYPYVRVPERI